MVLELKDSDSKRMLILVRNAKNSKERYTLLSQKALIDLRAYYVQWKPKKFLFEGAKGGIYSTSSVKQIVTKAAKKAKITKIITPHMLRHSFATHVLENSTNLRQIQLLLGHNSSKSTEIHTHVTISSFESVKNPLDL